MRNTLPLSASEAAARLGVSTKALRLYEQRGLLAPDRTQVGYRAYNADDMVRAAEIVTLRTMGLSLAQVGRVLSGGADGLEPALAAHEAQLERGVRQLVDTMDKVRRMRADIARGHRPAKGALANLLSSADVPATGFALPLPWGGEWFELRDIRPLNYVIGPLGSGKTRLLMQLANALPNAVFLGLSRTPPASCLQADLELASRVGESLSWLLDEGATKSDNLFTLLVNLEAKRHSAIVVDMVEQGLDGATQEALSSYLRLWARTSERPLFMTTRSSSMLDLSAVSTDEAIFLCPANHNPPMRVAPYPGAPGYEAVETCLASPEVRARSAGLVVLHV